MKIELKLLVIILFPFLIGISLPETEKDSGFFPEEGAVFYPERLDGPFTGGFGEQTCRSCHFDYDLNMAGGGLTLQGLPGSYQPGKQYELTVSIQSERLEVGGFQMTSRFEDGTQAGVFEWEGNRLMFTPAISNDVQYLQHSREGTSPAGEQKISWTFLWQAPEKNAEKVFFNLAANAGNNDDSAFGDWIYVKERILEPAQ